jgi:hypothetical protein
MLLDPGTITLENTWAAAFGSPATNPSVRSVNASQISLATTFYQPVTDTVSFTNSQPVDFVVQGYFQVDSGTIGQTINIAPFLDGVRQSPIATLGIPQHGYEGINFLSVLPNLQAGTHHLEWRVVTNGNTTLFSNRAIDGVAFPASTYQVLAQSTSTLTVTSSTAPQFLDDLGCGWYTQLLTGTIAADAGQYGNFYEGFVELTGAHSGTGTYAHMSFETIVNATPPVWTDGGARAFEYGSSGDGVYIVGDTGAFGSNNTATINLWARKVNAACAPGIGGTGTFDVGKRFFWVRHIPITLTACAYQ